MRLLDLPEDVLYLVVANLPAKYLFRTSRTCRKLNTIITPRLIDGSKLDLYLESLDFDHKGDSSPWSHPAQVLYQTDHDPQIAAHIQSISFESWDPGYGAGGNYSRLKDYHSKSIPGANSISSILSNILISPDWPSKYVNLIPILDDKRGLWVNAIRQIHDRTRRPIPILLLCMLCPNLEKLRIHGGFRNESWWKVHLEPMLQSSIYRQLPLFAGPSGGLRYFAKVVSRRQATQRRP